MAEVKKITVVTAPLAPAWRMFVRHAMLWTFLVGAEGASHTWFGGSWVVDFLVMAMLVMWVSSRVAADCGSAVEMTTSELRDWVQAGMPPDVRSWRASMKLCEE